jgi:hypothetical protein
MNNNISKEAFSQPPRITQELLIYLDEAFPESCAALGDDIQTIFFRSGSRAVVRHLHRLYKEQEAREFNLD